MNRKIARYILTIMLAMEVFVGCGNAEDTKAPELAEGTKLMVDGNEPLEAIVYNGVLYCGLPMSRLLPPFPEDFVEIGTFQGALTEEREELTATIIFRDDEPIYHYIDEYGRHCFCVRTKQENVYGGIFDAMEYIEGVFDPEIAEPRKYDY